MSCTTIIAYSRAFAAAKLTSRSESFCAKSCNVDLSVLASATACVFSDDSLLLLLLADAADADGGVVAVTLASACDKHLQAMSLTLATGSADAATAICMISEAMASSRGIGEPDTSVAAALADDEEGREGSGGRKRAVAAIDDVDEEYGELW